MEGYPIQKEEPFPDLIDPTELPIAAPEAQSCEAARLGKPQNLS